MNIIKQVIPTTNYQTGRNGKSITKIVIHWFGKGKLAQADAQFKKVGGGTSAHYGVEDDTVYQWVEENSTAYHSGNFSVNLQSIGIEHSAEPGRDASEATYQSSGKLLGEICNRYNIPLDRTHIIKHSEVKATQCPGTLDLDKLISIAGGYMSEIDDLKQRVAGLEKEVADKNIQIGNYAQQVTGLQQLAKDEYQRGFREGQASSPGVDLTEWEVGGLTIETTTGNETRILNYRRKV